MISILYPNLYPTSTPTVEQGSILYINPGNPPPPHQHNRHPQQRLINSHAQQSGDPSPDYTKTVQLLRMQARTRPIPHRQRHPSPENHEFFESKPEDIKPNDLGLIIQIP